MSDHTTVVVGPPTGRLLSPDLWGLFLEDINYALDGGLNADLVRNGDFEATPADARGHGPLTGWRLADPERVQVRSDAPLAQTNRTYLRLDATLGPTSVRNRGYDEAGMFLRPGAYRVRLAARSSRSGTRLRLRLAVESATLCDGASIEIDETPGTWNWYESDLIVTESSRGELEIALDSGIVDVDLIELRPVDPESADAFLFRPDLVEALARLRPAFVRFPGGCVAHGYGLDNIYHWKQTIGPREARQGMPNTWGYRQSMRIGYHEYFLLCELLEASPMPVVAAGVCCQNVPGGPQAIPQQRMPQYIQDVLDLIEYANGPADSRWGAVRAAAGHPEPFGLRYLGLGNEDVVDEVFEDRFGQIFAAVQTAHPEVTVIGTLGPKPYGPDYDNGWRVARRHGVRMVDEHSYRTPRWLLQNVDRFGTYDRSGPSVYLGEWAGRTSTVRSAVAEAAYMVGIERNSDIVRLASYAPLLARVGSTQWVPDLIYFTDEDVLPSASYHVARMLAEHRGEEAMGCQVISAPSRIQPPPSLHTIELRSPGATTHFSSITVNGASREAVTVTDSGTAVVEGAPTEEGVAELMLTAVRSAGEDGFVVAFGDPRTETMHECHIGEWRNSGLTLSRRDDGITDEIDGPHPFPGVRTGVATTVRVRLEGPRISVWLDDELIHDHLDDLRSSPTLVAGATRRGAESLITLVSAAATSQRVSITGLSARAGAVVPMVSFAGADPTAGKPGEASPVEPRAGRLISGDGRLELELAPWSVTTLTVDSTG